MSLAVRAAAWLIALACVGCSVAPPGAESLYSAAEQDLLSGRLAQASERVAQGLRTVRSHDDPTSLRFRLLQIEVLLAQGSAAQADDLIRHLPAAPRSSAAAAKACLLTVNAATKLGDLGRARSTLESCREVLAAQPAGSAVIDEAGVIEGLLLTREEKLDEASSLLRRTSLSATRNNHPYWQAAAEINLGYASMSRTRYDEAILSLDPAIQAASSCGAQRFLEWALINKSICQYRLGDIDAARSGLERALQINGSTGDRAALQATLGETANLAMFDNRPRDAAGLYEKAFAIAETLAIRDRAGLWAENMSAALIETGDLDGAEKWNDKALARYGAAIEAAPLARCQRNAAAIAVERGQYDEAERIYAAALHRAAGNPILEWEMHADIASLYTRLGRAAAAGREYEAALRRIESARADLLRTSFQATFLSQLIRFYQRYVEMLIDRGDTAGALRVVESSRARLLASAPPSGKAVDYRAIARNSRAVLLSYWLAPTRSSLWVVTGTAVRYFDLPKAADIEDLVTAHRNAVLDLRDPRRAEFAPSRRLFRTLIGPAMPFLRDNRHVTVVLDGALHRLNFETLVDDADRYWIEDATISVAPSLAAAAGGRAHSVAGSKALLLIGDPEQASPAFPRLKYAATEMKAVGDALSTYSKTVYQGEAARPSVYRAANPGRFAIIHFAAHADANAESPLDSSIVLARQADGFKLYASEFADLPISADLVTISSCRSAGAKSYAGEGLVGLAWAFLHAGARHVVAGLWDVNDESTARLMRSMYAHIAAGEDDAAALRTAKLEMIAASGTSYRKPYYWAPFILYKAGD